MAYVQERERERERELAPSTRWGSRDLGHRAPLGAPSPSGAAMRAGERERERELAKLKLS